MNDEKSEDEYTFMEWPKPSGWVIYLYGSDPKAKSGGFIYEVSEGHVPNAFIRWMMKVCLGCTWVKQDLRSK